MQLEDAIRTRLDFLPDGSPAIAWTNDGCSTYVHRDPNTSQWSSVCVQSGGPDDNYVSLAVSPVTGQPAISFFHPWDYLGFSQPPAWSTETVDPGTDPCEPSLLFSGVGNDLAYRANGLPSIAYYRHIYVFVFKLMYASHNGSGWQLETLTPDPSAWAGASLVFLPGDRPAIGQSHAVEGNEFRWKENGTWNLVEVDGPSSTNYVVLDCGAPATLIRDPLGRLAPRVGRRPSIPGDMNSDCVVNFADINPFSAAIGGKASFECAYPCYYWLNADLNGDGTVNFADINLFMVVYGSTCD